MEENGGDHVSELLWWLFSREELRLDVDGHYPQMVASGTLRGRLSPRVHWIANLTPSAPNTWIGNIWYKDGGASFFPYTEVTITVKRGWFSSQRKATVVFEGGGGTRLARTYWYRSPHFHPVNFEFDAAEDTEAVTSVRTCEHPNHPPSLPCEKLTIQTAYRRAGFNVTTSPGGTVPLGEAGPDARWSDTEMHDAMQTYWSRFAPQAQWAMWVFFASLHQSGTGLGGIMFDDIGPNHRQGTAIFNDSFIAQAPAGDPNPDAWRRRSRFWTACHEMGHAFNLAHSWQKDYPSFGSSWIPLVNDPEARSFMNYPTRVSGGQSAFFSDFEYRFIDPELLFLRHAPGKFVQMGNADWFDHHGFEEAKISPEPTWSLDLRVNRERAVFEFLEPIAAELKLTNVSSGPQIVDDNILQATEEMTVIIKKHKRPARQFHSYARYHLKPSPVALKQGESIYESLFISAGLNGWDMAEPGVYTLQVALHLPEEDVVSKPLQVRVATPRSFDEESLAQDFFSDDVGRILAFDGSEFFAGANDTLREVTARLPDRRVAFHLHLPFGNVLARKYKRIVGRPGDERHPMAVEVVGPKEKDAERSLEKALFEKASVAVETLGHIDYKWYVDQYSQWLADQGRHKDAADKQGKLHETMSARKVNGRGVLESVLGDIENERKDFLQPNTKGKKARPPRQAAAPRSAKEPR